VRSLILKSSSATAAGCNRDKDEPISVYPVSRRMGHGGTALVNRTYSHLGTVRHRAKVLEYRVEQHGAILGDRLGVVWGNAISAVSDSVSGAPQSARASS